MCGIAGCVVAAAQEPSRAALEEMAGALSHRGPDDRGMATAGNVGLVNARLAIVDPSPAGHQPMADAAGRWVLTYNGEIFNHRSLRRELPAQGWNGGSDTETLLAALATWGEDAMQRCNGFFAFAALDRARSRLLLARDRFGVKPLYLARHDGGLWFASEMRALLAGGIPARVRPDVLAHTATQGWATGRQTPIEAIERVPPGSALIVDTRTLQVVERRWFELGEPVDPELAAELGRLNRAQLADRLEEALRAAVRRRLLGDVPVGTACSGGLDSSLVTALAREEERSIVAFNASLVEEGRVDEARWAEVATRSLGVELETVRITASQWRGALVGAVAHHEYPLSPSCSSAPLSLIARRARRRGVKVLLTGEAADELFGGYPLAHGREFLRFLRTPLMLRRAVEEARSPRGAPVIGRVLRDSLRLGSGGAGAAPGAPAGVVGWRDLALREARKAYAHHPGSRGQLEAALLGALWLGPFGFLLNRMDKDLMSRSVETRMPFLDREVVGLALNLPLEDRVGPSVKGVLRDLARRHLPGPIVRRAKQPGMNFNAGRRIEEAARPGFLEQGYLREMLGLGASDWRAMAVKKGARLWTAEIWCRLFVEGEDVASVERELWVPELAQAV